MGRPAAEPYTLGRLTFAKHPTSPGQVQARGYFRDGSNTRREVTANGKTEAAARRALQGKVNAARDE